MQLSALLAATWLLLAVSVDTLAASEVRGVRLWRAPDNTRLVFDLSGPVQHRLFILAAPNRVVVDFKGAQLATNLKQLSLANTPITSVRSEQRSPDELRIVIDLSAAVSPKSFYMAPNQQYGIRMVVDLFDAKVRVDTVSARAIPPLESNALSNSSTTNAANSNENSVTQDSSQAVTESKTTDRNLSDIASSSKRLKNGTVKSGEPGYRGNGYTAAPGRYQPKNELEADQERAVDEWVEEERAKLHGATGNAASRTGYTAAPRRYQPQNKLEAEQERAMDEWMEGQ